MPKKAKEIRRKSYWLFFLLTIVPSTVVAYFIGEYRRSKYLHYQGRINAEFLKSILTELDIDNVQQVQCCKKLVEQRAKSLRYSRAFFRGLATFFLAVITFLKPILELLPKSMIPDSVWKDFVLSVSLICFYGLIIYFFFLKPYLEDFLDIDYYKIEDLHKTLEDMDLIYFCGKDKAIK